MLTSASPRAGGTLLSNGKMSDKIRSTVLSSKGGMSLSNLLGNEEIKGEECSSVKEDEECSRGELL